MTWRQTVENWRSSMLTDCPDAANHLSPLVLSLLCFHLAQQRSILSPLPTTQRHRSLCTGLRHLRDRGFPIPADWFCPPFYLSDSLVVALLDRLPLLSVECLGQAYELLRSQPHRRAQSAFYTPIGVADSMVAQTIASQASATPRILDPACGGGMFLLRAYQHLIEAQQPSSADRLHLLQACIYGLDIDPQAVAIAQIALLLKAVEGLAMPRSLPDLDQNLRCGNAVIAPDPNFLQPGGFDVVIGNPPYLDAEQMTLHCPDWRHYCVQHYRSARGNWDLFCVFIEQALNLCCPGGLTSMIVPNKLISASYAAGARSLLAQDNQLLVLRDYSSLAVFAASVYPIVYLTQKQPPTRSALVRYEVMQCHLQEGQGQGWQVQETHWLSYSHFTHDRLPWLLTARSQPSLFRLQALPTLATIAQVSGAATVAEAYWLQPFIHEGAAEGLRFVNSGTIDRYRCRWGEKPLRYLGARFDRPVVRLPVPASLHKRFQQACQPKLIVAGMTRQLECAADLDGKIWPGKSTCVIRSPDSIDLRYLLALLNSSVINRYLGDWFQGNRLQGGYLRVSPAQLRQMPLPDLSDRAARNRHDRLVAIVPQRLDACLTAETLFTLEAQIDDLVCELYQLTDGEVKALRSP